MSYRTFYIVAIAALCVVLTLGILMYKAMFSVPVPVEQVVHTATTSQPLAPAVEQKLQAQIAPLIAAGDISACSSVADKSYQTVCVNNIALNEAKKTGDISYCQYLDNVMIPRSICEQQVVFQKSVVTNDVTVCQEAQDATVRKDCIDSFQIRLAEAKGDINACGTGASSTRCRDTFAVQAFMTNPPQADCSIFGSAGAQADCTAFQTAFVTGRPDMQKIQTVCQNLKTSLFSQICGSVSSNPVVSAPPVSN